MVDRTWDFGDGTRATATPSPIQHNYTVGAVIDDAGSSSLWAADIPFGLVMDAFVYRPRSRLSVSLAWKGAETPKVDIFVNGSRFDTTDNTGTYRMSLRARGTYAIRVCETGPTPMCSAEQPVS